jgi:2-succinyl-6-hydroxy-2,4-cyclohexadiene-1-carboxylate synthase
VPRSWTTRPTTLHTEESTGSQDEHRLILLHGFTQTSGSWNGLVDALGDGPTICRVDAPGHGHSPILDDDLFGVARRVIQAAGEGVYVGYSMGARVLLHAALGTTAMRGLVLIGGTPGIEDDDERADRRESDRLLAQRISVEGVDAFLDWWLSQPLFAGLTPTIDDLRERRLNSVEGLVSSLRHCGVGEQTPLWDRLSSIRIPVLVMAGSHDTKFDAIGRRMTESIGANATFVSVPDAGHAAHLERPDAVAGIMTDWLA